MINLLRQRGDDRGTFLVMKSLKPTVCKFKVVIPRENGEVCECEISNLPTPDHSADTAEKSEVSELYFGPDNEYYVEVACSYAHIFVTVFDKNGKEIRNFEIRDIVEAD